MPTLLFSGFGASIVRALVMWCLVLFCIYLCLLLLVWNVPIYIYDYVCMNFEIFSESSTRSKEKTWGGSFCLWILGYSFHGHGKSFQYGNFSFVASCINSVKASNVFGCYHEAWAANNFKDDLEADKICKIVNNCGKISIQVIFLCKKFSNFKYLDSWVFSMENKFFWLKWLVDWKSDIPSYYF